MRSIKWLHEEMQKIVPEFFEEDDRKFGKLAFKIVENDFFKAPEAKWQSFDDYYNTIMIPIISRCMDKHEDTDKYVKCISIFSTKPEEEIRRDLLGEIE